MLYFLLGILTTIATSAILKTSYKPVEQAEEEPEIDIDFNQTNVHELMKLMRNSGLLEEKESQSKIHSETKRIRFVQTPDNKVYWMDEGVVYVTSMSHGDFDPGNGTPIDMTNLSKDELARLLVILDALQNG